MNIRFLVNVAVLQAVHLSRIEFMMSLLREVLNAPTNVLLEIRSIYPRNKVRIIYSIATNGDSWQLRINCLYFISPVI